MPMVQGTRVVGDGGAVCHHGVQLAGPLAVVAKGAAQKHVLHLFQDSLRAHRASGIPDERWRM